MGQWFGIAFPTMHYLLPRFAGSNPLDWMDDLKSGIFGFLIKNWIDSDKKVRGSPKFAVRGRMARSEHWVRNSHKCPHLSPFSFLNLALLHQEGLKKPGLLEPYSEVSAETHVQFPDNISFSWSVNITFCIKLNKIIICGIWWEGNYVGDMQICYL